MIYRERGIKMCQYQKIREECNSKDFYVFPEMSDGGISYGAVCAYLDENKRANIEEIVDILKIS